MGLLTRCLHLRATTPLSWVLHGPQQVSTPALSYPAPEPGSWWLPVSPTFQKYSNHLQCPHAESWAGVLGGPGMTRPNPQPLPHSSRGADSAHLVALRGEGGRHIPHKSQVTC